MIVHPAALEEVEALIREIREEITGQNAARPLSISAGYDELADSEDSIETCIQRADRKLYLDKAARHVGR